ncbi:unnamed protein product [Sphagnum troendelagicum]|uniref:Uncharacterized protein n=1 Tax=Sphagnum troendelagicum TaxID=128251 RepID=A0ABP0U1R4_9BRYO
MQSLLERVEMNMTKRDSQAGNMEVEVNEWHCQVLRLLFQLEIVDTSSRNCLCGQSACSVPGQEMEGVIPVMSRAVKEQKEKIDLSRRQYLAATIAAPELPSEELLTLGSEYGGLSLAGVMTAAAIFLLGSRDDQYSSVNSLSRTKIAVKPKSAIDFAHHVFMDFDQDNAIELWLYLLFFSRFQEKQKPIWLNCNFVLQVLPLSDMI